jgi:diacylglycerol kinase family enzyme
MKVAVVLNSRSGASLEAGLDVAIIAEALRHRGVDACAEPDDGRSLTERVDAALRRPGLEALIAGGGDGTILCAAERLQGTGVALGILPLGTMNLLAKDVGIPIGLDGAIAALAGARRQRIDVGEVNGRLFLIKAVLGAPAKMARLREVKRGRMSLTDLARICLASLRFLRQEPSLTISVESGGERRRLRSRALAVVNNDFAEGFGQLFTRTRLDGGHLTLYAALNFTARKALRLGLGMAVGHWRNTPGLIRAEAGELTIDCPRRSLRVMLDGEVISLQPPLHFRLLPGALEILVPQLAADAGPNASPAGA